MTTGYQTFKQQQQQQHQSGGFNGFNPSGTYASGTKPIFESVNNYDGSSSLGTSNFGTSGFGNVNSLGSDSFHATNPDYYKKALKGSSGINSINGIGSYGNGGGAVGAGAGAQYGGLYSSGATNNYQQAARQDNLDCVCVPFDQCPARDVLGRKGDLILPLDPRNLGSDIEAISDDSNATSNGTTVTRVTKQATDKSDENADENESPLEPGSDAIDKKKVSKREVSDNKSNDLQKADGEAVSTDCILAIQISSRSIFCYFLFLGKWVYVSFFFSFFMHAIFGAFIFLLGELEFEFHSELLL